MSETYQITTPNGLILQVDKGTNKIHFVKNKVETGKYTEEYSKALLEAWQIMEEAKKQYKPLYLDPTLKTNPNHFKEFQSFRNLYLKDPIKKAIAPWTKKEKAYYESLQTKRERYQYLVIRSGLRSAVIDIPFDAIGGVDEKGRVINKEYEDIFYQVDRNKDTLKSEFFATEWGIAAGILGNPEYFASDLTGFTARYVQSTILYIQLNPKIDYRGILKIIEIYGKDYVGSFRTFKSGLRKNPLRQQQLIALAKSIKPDRFGMLPYIDEIMGVDWVMDLNMLYGYSVDGDGWTIEKRIKEIDEGKLLDPRDPQSTKQTRLAFKERLKTIRFRRYDTDLPNDWTQKKVDLYIDSMLLEAKIMAVSPPQGYPNAPTYYIPEYLDELYEAGKLDKLLNPTIPAIYRETFPQELRDKIEWYAKKHHIK
ncbi:MULTISPECIES: hypothetical protein [Helicobacter]|jgi:hypothetical protein|uniref:Uncharacterized protein n=1 Tax=Helicobacter hepaticus (strain ATCC 51449 / 3B1) TaxID=235279 RepID=Q7VJI9_HELHP|nr:hypothetical protein [Helicobacter hepaticus]AAP76851.1 hypothetical protein HH_0254 [Helicobacter hepaticus ATCC 51449]